MRAEPLDAQGRVVDPHWPATHLLVCRRTRQYFNSTGQDLERLRVKGVTNYAHMHPDDLLTLSIADDDVVEISTPHAQRARRREGVSRHQTRRDLDGARLWRARR